MWYRLALVLRLLGMQESGWIDEIVGRIVETPRGVPVPRAK